VADQLWSAIAERDVAHLAVSGGTTPKAMFGALATLPPPWDRVHVWQVDERVAPDGDPARNLGRPRGRPAVEGAGHAPPCSPSPT
jgi:6-phosphogluconolactonase